MSAPKAKTKMTRSNWPKANRPKTKSHALHTSQQVTVMSRFGGKSLANYATTYMSRDKAAIPAVDDVEMVPHVDNDGEVLTEELVPENVSRQSMGLSQESRLFDGEHLGLSDLEVSQKVQAFEQAQKKGHTPIIQVVSFAPEYLQNQHVLETNDLSTKGYLGSQLDDTKLRIAIQQSVQAMAKQAGFADLEYVAAIHGNTEHPHVHLAMIETDDNADERLAARVVTDQADDNQDQLIGKSPAAKAYDKAHHVTNTVERGMMRQSELDYFRQNIDHSLKNIGQLATVRDLEYQQTYAQVISGRALAKEHANDQFVADFVEVSHMLQQNLTAETPVYEALDLRVSQMSRQLLSGVEVGQTEYLQKQVKFAKQLALEASLKNTLAEHANDKPSFQVIEEYRSMNLEPDDYNGAVLTPSEMMAQDQTVNRTQYFNYVAQYQQFIEEPNIQHMNGLIVRDKLDTNDLVKDYVKNQEQLLVDTTKATVYDMLQDVKASGATSQEIADGLKGVTKTRSREHLVKQVADNVQIDSLQKQLAKRQVKPEYLAQDKTLQMIAHVNQLHVLPNMPKEIQSAHTLLKNEYGDHIEDLTGLLKTVDGVQDESDEDLRWLVKKNQSMQRLAVQDGEITASGQMLYAVMAADIRKDGATTRLNQLSEDDQVNLINDYQVHTTGKMATIQAVKADLDGSASLTEPASVQDTRQTLSDAMGALNDIYAARLEYVDTVVEINEMTPSQRQQVMTNELLSEAMWRQGVDQGQSFQEIQANIKAAQQLSPQEQLAKATQLRLTELDNHLAETSQQVDELAEKWVTQQVSPDDRSVMEIVADEVQQQSLHELPQTLDIQHAVDKPVDIMYNASQGTLVVDNEVMVSEIEPKESFTVDEAMALNLVIGSVKDVRDKSVHQVIARESPAQQTMNALIVETYAPDEQELLPGIESVSQESEAELQIMTQSLQAEKNLLAQSAKIVKQPKVVTQQKIQPKQRSEIKQKEHGR